MPGTWQVSSSATCESTNTSPFATWARMAMRPRRPWCVTCSSRRLTRSGPWRHRSRSAATPASGWTSSAPSLVGSSKARSTAVHTTGPSGAGTASTSRRPSRPAAPPSAAPPAARARRPLAHPAPARRLNPRNASPNPPLDHLAPAHLAPARLAPARLAPDPLALDPLALDPLAPNPPGPARLALNLNADLARPSAGQAPLALADSSPAARAARALVAPAWRTTSRRSTRL
jgi:hypothetical protein